MADKYLKVEIITPQSVVYSGDAVSINVPGSLSPFQILINHAPIVSSLENGIIKINSSDNKETFFAVNSGFVEVKDNIVAILVELAIESTKIDKNIVLDNIEKLKINISSSKSNTEKLMLASRLTYEQVKLKTATLTGRN